MNIKLDKDVLVREALDAVIRRALTQTLEESFEFQVTEVRDAVLELFAEDADAASELVDYSW